MAVRSHADASEDRETGTRRARFLHFGAPMSSVRFRIVCLVVCLAGAAACSGGEELPTSPTPGGGAEAPVSYTVLGASDGIGYGSSVVCAPFDLGCENGTGYAQTLRRRLLSDGRSVTYVNLSVPGAVLSRTIVDLAIQLGLVVYRNDRHSIGLYHVFIFFSQIQFLAQKSIFTHQLV